MKEKENSVLRLGKKWAISFFYLWIVVAYVKGQDLSFRQFTIEDGLPSNQIYDIHQDQKGFIWFATENGLSKYNGAQFINYTLSDGLPDTEITSFFEDSKNRLWFCTFNGQLGFYKDGVFHNPKNTEFLRDGYLNNSILNTIEDNEGNIYFSYDQLIIRLNAKNELTKINAVPHSDFVMDIHGQIYIHPQQISESTSKLVKIPQLESVPYQSIEFDMENKYKLVYSKAIGFNTVHPISPAYQKGFRMKPNQMVLEKGNSYWLSSPTTPLEILSANKNGELDLQYKLDNLNLAKGFIDRENCIWYGSLGKGAFRFDESNAQVYRLGKHLEGELLSSLFIDQQTNRIYCGTTDGVLNIISGNDIQQVRLAAQDKGNPRIRDIEKDKFNRLWLTCDAFLLAYDAETLVPDDIVGINTNFSAPKDVTMDKDSNQIMIATNHWTLKYGYNEHSLLSRKVLVDKRSTFVHIDDDQQVWSGTTKGLFCHSINDSDGKEKSIGEDPISCINHFGKTILAGTKGKGLLIINGDSITNISTKQGLPSNLIRSIQVFDDENIWVSTNEGLCKINNLQDASFSIQVINEENGLISNNVIDCGIVDSLLYVLSANGLSVLNVSEIEDNPLPPKINLEQMLVNEKNMPFDALKELRSKQNNISFLFSGIHFGNRNNLVYLYKLDGYHVNWQKTRNENLVFEHLPPGKYTFEIYASVNGIRSSNTEKINFEIIPAFHQRLEVRLLAIAIFPFGLFLFIRMLIAREKEKNKIEKRLLQLEQLALQSQMNPHFIKNSLGAIQYLMIKKDVRTANKYLTVFGELITKLLMQSDQSQIKVQDEIEILELYLSIEKLRFDNNFEYRIVYNLKEIFDEKIPSMMIQPLVENAIIHGFRDTSAGRKNKLNIKLELQNEYLACTVEDNGSGIKKIADGASSISKRRGIALKNIKERISLLALKKPATTFEIVSTNSNGTFIKLCLPLSR